MEKNMKILSRILWLLAVACLQGMSVQKVMSEEIKKTENTLFTILVDSENIETKLQEAQKLIDEGVDVNQLVKYNSLEYTPLYAAVLTGDKALVQLLLDRGATKSINTPVMGDHSTTPLHAAIRRHKPEMVEVLLNAGADPLLTVFSTISNRQVTALELAQELGFKDIVEIIRSYQVKH